MKKLLSMLGAIGLVATSSATVVSCGDKDEVFDFGKMTAMEPELELIGDANAKTLPTPQAILDAFNAEKKLKLTLADDVDITNIKAQPGASLNVGAPRTAPSVNFWCKITAKAESKKVTGVGGLLIKVSAMDLANVTTKALTVSGNTDSTDAPDNDEVLANFISANNLSFKNTDLKIALKGTQADDKTWTFTISSADNSTVVTGNVDVIVTVVPLDLSKATTTLTIIGDVKSQPLPSEQAILVAFNKANESNVKLGDDVSITAIAGAAPTFTATITANKNSKSVSGTVNVTITIERFNLANADKASLTLPNDLVATDEDKVAAAALAAFNAVNNLSPSLLGGTDVKVTPDLIASNVTISAVDDSKLVAGDPITLSYTIATE